MHRAVVILSHRLAFCRRRRRRLGRCERGGLRDAARRLRCGRPDLVLERLDLVRQPGVLRHKAPQALGERQRPPWFIGQPLDQLAQDAELDDLDLAGNGLAPGLVFQAALERQVGEKGAADRAEDGFELLRRTGRKVCLHQRQQPGIVEPGAKLERDGVALGHQRGLVLAQYLPDLGEAPAQGSPGIVGYVPEYLAEPLALVLPAGDGEIGEQGPGLSRRRHVEQRAAAGHLEITEHAHLQQPGMRTVGHAPVRPSLAIDPSVSRRRIERQLLRNIKIG